MKYSRIFIIGFTLSLLTFAVSNYFHISYAAATSLTHENSHFKTSISTSDFSQKDNPQISVEDKPQVTSGFLKLIPKFIYNPPTPKALISTLKVTVKNADGTTLDYIQPKIEEIDGKISVSLDKNQLKPGKYSFEISSEDGSTITQDFTWGVLSLNPDQSSYSIGDTAFLAMAVLDDHGDMVCNSALTLVITKPDGTTTTLSTQNGQITVNNVCHTKEITLIPDYQALFNIDQIGNYNYTLTANTQNGIYSISDSFIAQNNPDFVIKRLAVTRIYPPNTYPVTLKITANRNFTGTITESVPSSFKITNTLAKITTQNDRKLLTWTLSLSEGQTISLKYSYLAPMVSPERYLLGPITFTQNNKIAFTEPRTWQIASDATATLTPADTSWVVPDNVYSLKVEAWGGGGGGASRNTAGYGGGGGGGAYSNLITYSVSPGQTLAVSVGAGGGASSSGNDTYFINTSTLLAKGGSEGILNSQTGASGGLNTNGVGDTKYSGGNGGDGIANNGGGGGGGAGNGSDGSNGSAPTGGNGGTGSITGGNGGNGGVGTASSAGSPGSTPSGGGGGAFKNKGGTIAGSAGADGQIIITYTTNSPPNTPTNSTPSNGATDISLNPTLTASTYSDPESDAQNASQWQIATDSGFSTVVWDTGTTGPSSNTINVGYTLSINTVYYWHVSYQAIQGNWSTYSVGTSFTTIGAANQAPNLPALISPGTGDTNVSQTPSFVTIATDNDNDTLQYEVKICTDSGMSTGCQTFTAADTGWSGADVGTSSYSFGTTATYVLQTGNSLAANTEYFWKTRAIDPAGSNTYSSTQTTAYSFTTLALNQNPNQPTNSTPASGTGGLSFTPTLTASSFSDPDGGDTQAASQWQVATDTGFSSVVFDTGTTGAASNSVNVTTTLNVGTTYYWHVRYQDNHGAWSTYSSYTNFTTNKIPNTPTNSTPGTGTTAVSVNPTLTSSAFSDPDGGDTQSAAQWQISTQTGASFDSNLVWDSSTTSSNKTSVVVSTSNGTFQGALTGQSRLAETTLYYWRLRHRDNSNNWSAYSTITSFTSGTAPIDARAIPARYWKFDEGYGIVTHDQNGYTETLAGSSLPTWLLDGKFNKALSFPGANSGVNIGSTAGLDLAASNFSISAWVNPSSTVGIHSIFSTSKGIFYIEDGILKFQKSSASWDTIGTGVTIPTNTWTHVAIIRSGVGANQTELYINGYLAQTGAIADLGSGATNPTIGYEVANGRYFAGSIDDLKVYTSAISQNNLKVDYNNMSARVLGSISTNSSGQSSKAYSGIYCVPGSTDPCTAPVAEWKFEEGIGTTAYNTSGNNNGILTNSPIWSTGKIGKSILFNGNNNYINIPTLPSITAPYTVEFWFYPKTLGTSQTLLSLRDINAYPRFSLTASNKLLAYAGAEKYRYGAKTFTAADLNKWWHVTFVIADSASLTNWKVYLNGIDDSSTTGANSGTYYEPSTSGVIGSNISGEYFSGKIDDVRIFNYARTPAQIAYDYNKGAPIAWYKLDECQGSIAHNSSGIGYTGSIIIGGGGAQNGVGNCTTSGTAWGVGATGKFNSSLNLDGNDDYISIGQTIPNIQTVALWIKPTSTTQSIIDLDNGTHKITISSGTVSASGFSAPSIYVDGKLNGTVPDTNWHHISVTTATPFSSSTLAKIGVSGSTYYSGKIDDIRIYNYPLTSTQVKSTLNSGAINFR